MRGFIAFLVYVILEFAATLIVALNIGWFAVFMLFVAGFAFGLVIMSNAGTTAATALRESSHSGTLPEGTMGDSALKFAGGALIAIPGFLTDLVGLLLMIPPIRRLTRRWGAAMIGRSLRKRGMSVVTTTVDGVPVTRVVPGDVVAGDVINRVDEPGPHPGGPSPENRPISGEIVGRDEGPQFDGPALP